MATPTLQAFRQLNPHLAGKSDDDLLTDLVGQLQLEGTLSQYPDVIEAQTARERAYRQAHKPGPLKELVRSTVGGIDTGQAQLYSAVGQAGDVAGIDAVKNFGLRGYQRNMQEAAENQPTVRSVDDIKSIGDAAYYGIGLVGSQAPQIGATLAASAAGGLVGGPAGAVAGGIGAGYVQSQNYADLELAGGENAAFTAAAVGAVSGLLEAVVPLKVLRTSFGSAPAGLLRGGIEHLLVRANAVIPGVVSAMQKEIVRNGSAEALTEVAQELTAMAGEMYSNRNNPSFEISDKEIRDRLLNSAAAGALLGGLTGAAEGPIARRNEINIKKAAGDEISRRMIMPPTRHPYEPEISPEMGFGSVIEPTTEPSPVDDIPAPARAITPLREDWNNVPEAEAPPVTPPVAPPAAPPVPPTAPAAAAPVTPPPAAPTQPPTVPPVLAERPTMAEDRARYDVIQQEMVRLTREGKTAADPEVAALFKENEDIKNRYGGMPPGEVSGGPDYEQQPPPPQEAAFTPPAPQRLTAKIGPIGEPELNDEILQTFAGKEVELEAVDEAGKTHKVKMDANTAWKETHNQAKIYKLLADCLNGIDPQV
jgi:hypothetical protein